MFAGDLAFGVCWRLYVVRLVYFGQLWVLSFTGILIYVVILGLSARVRLF